MNKRQKNILPAALLIEKRKCLIVGGGAVAGRKAEALAEAGADVTVVAPEICDAVKTLRDQSKATVHQREYVLDDLNEDIFLAITATANRALNQSIIKECQKRKILCSCPDHGWENGDFISPASFRHQDIIVSISTGGSSCRRARLVKENLARHVEALDRTELLVVGTDHRFTDINQRESLCMTGILLHEASEMLRQVTGIHEFMLLYTCNRIEFVGLAADSVPLLNIVKRTLEFDELDSSLFYIHRGRDAFRHLALVASGLLSQSIGESHILAQIKASLEESRTAGWSAGVLQDWVGRAFHIGKSIRHATRDLISAIDIDDTCKMFLEYQCGGIRNRRILVIGSGMVGKSLMEKFILAGACVSCCYRHNPPKLRDTTDNQPTVFPFKAINSEIQNHDIIVCAMRCETPLLTAEHGKLLERNIIVVDLGVPRNVARDFKNMSQNITLFDLDDIKRFQSNNTNAQEVLNKADEIISKDMEYYDQIIAGIQNGIQK